MVRSEPEPVLNLSKNSYTKQKQKTQIHQNSLQIFRLKVTALLPNLDPTINKIPAKCLYHETFFTEDINWNDNATQNDQIKKIN